MEFQYDAYPQRSPEWFKQRIGKVTASRLEDWLAISKKDGSPLKTRLDYERELQFERQFGINYNNFVSEAMLDGIDYEELVRREYEDAVGLVVDTVGCFYNDYFVASPDGIVNLSDKKENFGVLEIKVLRDANFTEVLLSGVPSKHWKQIQGSLWATGLSWADYVAMNITTRKMKVIRVEADPAFHTLLAASVQEPLSVGPFSEEGLFDVQGSLTKVFQEAL